MSNPAVSVVMAVYNGEEYLSVTLDSILRQSFSDWECVIVDDCSTDATPEILREYLQRDARFRVFRNEQNMRLQKSLNRGISEARGKYIVRIDADDVCRYDRLQKQFSFMEKHPELAMSASKYMLLIDGRAFPGQMANRTDSKSLEALFLYFNPICHPCVIMRSDIAKSMPYDENFGCSEDLRLWTQMVSRGEKIMLQNDCLVLYRRHPKQMTANSYEAQREQYARIAADFYAENLFCLDSRELEVQLDCAYFRSAPDIDRINSHIKRIIGENKIKKRFSDRAVKYASAELLLEYKRLGVSTKKVIESLLDDLGAGYVLPEIAQRLVRRVRDKFMRRRASKKFEKYSYR